MHFGWRNRVYQSELLHILVVLCITQAASFASLVQLVVYLQQLLLLLMTRKQLL